MTEWIALLALVMSTLSLIVHYRNQVERRHEEITQHRAGSLVKLSALQQRMISLKLHTETMRIELRKMPESDDKYESIELMPKLMSSITRSTEKVERIREKIEEIDTHRRNSSATLMMLQSVDHELTSLETLVSSTEKSTLSKLARIRTAQESTDIES